MERKLFNNMPTFAVIITALSMMLAPPCAAESSEREKLLHKKLKEHIALEKARDDFIKSENIQTIQDTFSGEMMRITMDSMQLMRDIRKTYQSDPSDQAAFQALIYSFQNPDTPHVKEEIMDLVIKHHIDKPELGSMVWGVKSIYTFVPNDQKFLEALIEKSPHNQVRNAARVALADGLNAIGQYLTTLNEFDVSLEETTRSQMRQAMAMFEGLDFSKMSESLPESTDEQTIEQLSEETSDLQEFNELINSTSSDPNALMEQAMNIALASAPQMQWKNTNAEELIERVEPLLLAATKDKDSYAIQYTVTDEELIHFIPSKSISDIATKKLDELRNALVGNSAPSLAFHDLKGNKVYLENYKGKVVMLDFWATWCGSCVAAIPANCEIAEHFKGRPFELITVSADSEADDVVEFMEETELPFTNWHVGDEGHAQKLTKKWRIKAFPTIVIIDAKGIVRAIPSVGHDALTRYLDKLVNQAEPLST